MDDGAMWSHCREPCVIHWVLAASVWGAVPAGEHKGSLTKIHGGGEVYSVHSADSVMDAAAEALKDD